ncbi:MAG: carboxypeptidase-like regulatory domain-containing protein [Acidobacteriota bacterium]
MQHRIAILLLSAALTSFPVCAQANSTLDGIVADRVTGLGIPNIRLAFSSIQGGPYSAITGSDGRFRITGMVPGIFESRVDSLGYQPFRRGPSKVELAPLGTTHLRVELTKEIAIRGRVVDDQGKPVPGVPVRYTGSGAPEAITNDRGEFVMTTSRLGSSLVMAKPNLNLKTNASGELVSMVTTYFPSAINPMDAQRILVRGDADIENLEIRLQSVAMHRVQGFVVDESGRPKQGVTVQLFPLTQQDALINWINSRSMNGVVAGMVQIIGPGVRVGTQEAQTITSADGTFEFPSVHSGDWKMTASDSNSPIYSNTTRVGAISTFVGRGDVLGLELRLSAPFTLTATAAFPATSGKPTDAPRFAISLTAADGSVPSWSALPSYLPDGAFQLPGIQPGKYFVNPPRTAGPLGGGGYYVSSIMLGGGEVVGRAVELAAGTPPIRVVYSPALGVIRGKVTNSDAAMVILLPQDLSGIKTGYFADVDKDGLFELGSLPPGDYCLAAFDRLEWDSLGNDPLVVRQVIARGKHIKIEPASQISVELAAIRWPE